MLPCGHVYYSLLAKGNGSDAQVIGAILPDAATTVAFSWTDLHDPARVEEFAATIDHSSLRDVVVGIRHHVELDERAHNAWRGGGGYAYIHQTPELQEAVGAACGVDGDLARTLAHNFIETAVDLHLLAKNPDVFERVQHSINAYGLPPLAAALGKWKQIDVDVMESRLVEFFDVWQRHDLATVDGMVELWVEVLDRLNRSTFNTPDAQPLNRVHAKRGIELAMDIAAKEFLDVITPD